MCIHHRWSPIASPDPHQTTPSHPPSTTSSHGTTHTHTSHSTSQTYTTKEPTTKKNDNTSNIVRKAPNKFPKLEGAEREGGAEEDKERRRERVEETRKEKSTISDDKETLKDDTKGGVYFMSCITCKVSFVYSHQTQPAQLRVKWPNHRQKSLKLKR